MMLVASEVTRVSAVALGIANPRAIEATSSVTRSAILIPRCDPGRLAA